MATTLSQTEAPPESYPVLSPAVPDHVWQRIESYVAWRWTARSVIWIVEGPGEWKPPLAPTTITGVQVWSERAGVFEDATLAGTPIGGYCLPCTGPYKFTGIVAGGSPAPTVPAIVAEAAQRLGAYMAAAPGKPGARSERISAGSIDIAHSRSESWMASAMQNSGAADLLRSYRKV